MCSSPLYNFIACAGDLQEVLGEKLLFSAYMCLHHISELKKAASLSDHTTQIQNARAVKAAMLQADNATNAELANMKADAQDLLGQLEESYYRSKHKGRPTESGVSEQLRELCQVRYRLSLAKPCRGSAVRGGGGAGEGGGRRVGQG